MLCREDRTWRFGCRKAYQARLLNCGLTGYINNFDQPLDHSVGSSQIITGMVPAQAMEAGEGKRGEREGQRQPQTDGEEGGGGQTRTHTPLFFPLTLLGHFFVFSTSCTLHCSRTGLASYHSNNKGELHLHSINLCPPPLHIIWLTQCSSPLSPLCLCARVSRGSALEGSLLRR